MEIELSEEQLKRWLWGIARLALIVAGLYLVWTMIIQPFLNTTEANLKIEAENKANVTAKQICSDIDSLNKLQQEPTSTNPSVQRMKALLANYRTQVGHDFDAKSCHP